MSPQRLMVLVACLVAMLPSLAWAEAPRRMDLKTLVRLALEENLEIQAQTYQTRSSDAVLRGAYG
ncbi:hypothetical protein, partial [Geoalkalibacter sp.]|uniref:hypothetical protein n=1 Tax=Geoalkalibacter sp. TaxID=3041440 RepID=UPI00272E5DDA